MSNVQIFYLLLFLGVSLYLAYRWFNRLRYRRAMAQPFAAAWEQHLIKRMSFYGRLPASLKLDLQQCIKQFLYQKQFIGCAGLEMSDEIRLVIAAEACLLLLNRPNTCYRGLRWIYVYPSTFIAKREQRDAYGVVTEGRTHLLGESWSNGRVILAWDSVTRGISDPDDGHNVVLHEFAHQLDQEDGSADGAPLLYTRDGYHIWSRVFSREFLVLQQRVSKGKTSLIDSYGAINPAEFFAVVTELFFERPQIMAEKHKDLFAALADYYRVDPRDW